MSSLFPESSGATFSPCRRYRYTLWRQWDERPPATFIMLNPSTADETRDDWPAWRALSLTASRAPAYPAAHGEQRRHDPV